MSPSEIIGITGGLGSVLGVIFVWLKARGDISNKKYQLYSDAENKVADRVRADLQRAFDRIDRLEAERLKDSERIDILESGRRRDASRIEMLISHIRLLEPMIPFPPGPPARPWFMKEDNHE
ncbi:exonuclease [Rathayibacter phage NCPPB3778]|nr:exonuclease [Rathayibacter phage NCPPB3778]